MDKVLKKIIKSIGTYEVVSEKLGISVRTLKRYVYGESKTPHNLMQNLVNLKEGRNVNLTSTDKTKGNVRELIENLGGIQAVSVTVGKTYQAVWKWYSLEHDTLPDESNWYLMKKWNEEKQEGRGN